MPFDGLVLSIHHFEECPPEPSVCINSVQLSVSGEGACVSGACVYPKDTVKCTGNKGGAGCVDGACALSCSGTVLNGVTVTDCDGSALNGCEAVMATDPNNCGVCGKTCGAGDVCTGGFCVATGSCRIALDCDCGDLRLHSACPWRV